MKYIHFSDKSYPLNLLLSSSLIFFTVSLLWVHPNYAGAQDSATSSVEPVQEIDPIDPIYNNDILDPSDPWDPANPINPQDPINYDDLPASEESASLVASNGFDASSSSTSTQEGGADYQQHSISLVSPTPDYQPRPGYSTNKYVFGEDEILNNPDWVANTDIPREMSPYSSFLFSIGGSQTRNEPRKFFSTSFSQKFVAVGLPNDNRYFGERIFRMLVSANPYINNQNPFSIVTKCQIFFLKESMKHPGNYKGKTPNWYYYYRQTSAGRGYEQVRYGPKAKSSGQTLFVDPDGNGPEPAQWVAYISPAGASAAVPPLWGGAKGIDYFAWIMRHEAMHKQQMDLLWGVDRNRTFSMDREGDMLPDDKEPGLTSPLAPRGYDPARTSTYLDNWGYVGLGSDINDVEHYCLSFQKQWANGSADKEDWATNGKNW